MHSKHPKVAVLRTIRKTSHLSGKLAKKSGNFMDKVERRTTRLIQEAAGSPTGERSIDVDELFYHHYPQLFPIHPSLPAIGQRPSITIFAFLDPRGFYGGIATLLLVGAALAKELGYDLRIAQTTGFSKDNDVLKFLASNGISISPDRYSTLDLSKRHMANFAYLPLHPQDIVLVSAWWDAHIAAQLPLSHKFIYLIQDYEPIFYNNSDSSVLADETYRTEKFIPICNTEILHKFFAENKYTYIAKNAHWFEPAPAPSTLPRESKTNKKNGKRKLFLYGRPHVHRNLFFDAIRALDIAFSDERLQGEDWELYCAGSGDVPAIQLHSGHIIKNLGKMGLDEYYAWARTVDVALSPMLAPHPNYPTLELASLGAMVVSTKWKTKQDLSFYSPNILMAEPSAEGMAEKIIAAALTPDSVRRANAKRNHINTDWSKALKKPVEDIAKTYMK